MTKISRDDFELLMRNKLLGNGDFYVTCKHKKSRRKRYHIASDTIKYRIIKLMKTRSATREVVNWFYKTYGNKEAAA